MKQKNVYDSWVKGVDYPDFMNEIGLTTLSKGYLIGKETPKDAIKRISTTASKILKRDDLEPLFFEAIWKGWICPSTPIWANFGAKRALPISCFGSYIDDSVDGIFETLWEVAKMNQKGGGTSAYFGAIRSRGAKIAHESGVSSGKKPWTEIYDVSVNKVSQGTTRRGNFAGYYDIEDPDFDEIINIREPGDPVQSLFFGFCIGNTFIEKLYDGDPEAWRRWAKILEARGKTGMPYLFFKDNINYGKSTPKWYGHDTGLDIVASNLCTEICLPSNSYWSFVCCLLSNNLATYLEWKDWNVNGYTIPQLSVYLLDAVMTEFIDKTASIPAMRKARDFAIANRALGIGTLGYHSFLQDNNIPFNSLMAKNYNKVMHKFIREEAEKATYKMGEEYGPCKIGDGKRRHSTVMAIAPTTSNAGIQNVSPNVEPWAGNCFLQKMAKGTFLVKNRALEKILKELEQNTEEVWESIKVNAGSVQHLDFLSDHHKEVFRTFKEINQFAIIDQAADRQEYIDQGQSTNINIPPGTDPKLISKLYLYAHAKGLKTLYYQRSETLLRGGIKEMTEEACVACSG